MDSDENNLKMIPILKEMIATVLPLSEDDPLGHVPSELYRLSRSILRKNLMRAQCVLVLSGFQKMGDGALEIARNMLEDVISLNYILISQDPVKSTHVFYEFRWVQMMQDYRYYKKLKGYKPSDSIASVKIIKAEHKRVLATYPEFKKGNSEAVSWSPVGFDSMAASIARSPHYSKEDIDNIKRIYLKGSRKTHFNPEDMLNYFDQEAWDKASTEATRNALLACGSALNSLTLRYNDVINSYDDKLSRYDISEMLSAKCLELYEADETQ